MRNKGKINWGSAIVLLALIVVYFATGGGLKRPAGDAPTPTVAPIATQAAGSVTPKATPAAAQATDKPGDKETVAAYIRAHGELPDYYITKGEAGKLGWPGGDLQPYAPGKMIGGDRFGNFEGLLPDKRGRTWQEADIGSFAKASRGPERIVFSNDGLIYYTPDHYESFVEMKEGR